MIAIYARQSKDKKDSISIESQIEFCEKEVLPEQRKDIIIYKDKGFSGKNLNRPQFDKMYQDIKNGLINTVIVYKLDRISRNLLDFCKLNDSFKQYNVNFISCNEKFDTGSAMGQAMLSICMVFAQLERQTIQTRIKDSYYSRTKKGFYAGGKIPYGYNKIPTKLDGKKTSTFKENKDAAIIKELFEYYSVQDHSLGDTAKYMNNKNTVSANGRSWDSCKVGRILRNPFYVKADANIYLYYKNKGIQMENEPGDYIGTNGLYLYNKRDRERIINKDKDGNIIGDHINKNNNPEEQHISLALHDGIIESDIFLLCQYKLDTNKQIGNSNKGRNSFITGLIKCGNCGYAVSVIKNRTGVRYLTCRGKSNLGVCEGFNKTIYAADIEEIVKIKILNKAKELQDIEYNRAKKDTDKQNKINIQIIEIDNKINNLLEQIADGNDTIKKYANKMINDLDKQKQDLLEQLKKEELAINKNSKISMKDIIVKLEDFDNLSFDEKKYICRYFISKILITNTKVKIIWNNI